MSCVLTASPRPLTISPFSVKAVCLLILFESEWRSSTLFATPTPLAFCHGPLPMRSRALTPAAPPGSVVLRYARQLVCVEPAALARAAQCAASGRLIGDETVDQTGATTSFRKACILRPVATPLAGTGRRAERVR